MFTIKLFKFNKKTNSTKRPTNVGDTFTCNIKSVSSILDPVIDIVDKTGENKIPLYNYAYISEFKRYYFITDITYNIGVWTLSLSVDVLASFRDGVLDSDQYVLRSSSLYDPDIVDTLYLSKNTSYWDKCKVSKYEGITGYANGVRYRNVNSSLSGLVSNYFNTPLSSGMFLIGVVGNNATGVDYYAMSYTLFKELINKVFTLIPSDMPDVSSGIANAIYDPIQYLTSCRWYPEITAININNATSSLKVGAYTVTLSGSVYPLEADRIPEFYIEIDIPRHPEEASYPYMNLSPFSEYNLYFQPFGNIAIDSTKIYGSEKLTVTWTVDYATGLAHLKIKPYGYVYDNEAIIFDSMCDYGVSIPISSLVMDWKAGAMLSGMNWIKDKINNYTSSRSSDNSSTPSIMNNPQYANAVNAGIQITQKSVSSTSNTNLLNSAMDVLGSALGQVHTSGEIGSFLSYNAGLPYIYAFFYTQVDHDNARFGRPYYRRSRLSNMQGYCLCSNAYINFSNNLNPTVDEYNSIISLLNSGVYIEV